VIQDHYGDVLFKLKRYDEAIAAWNRVLSGDGESIDRGGIDKKIRAAKQKLQRNDGAPFDGPSASARGGGRGRRRRAPPRS
jgi:hypothetical protein